ncbi:hypothetical protein ABIA00_007502 [Bradyrhizobium ottawaense]|uniref:hypothetical protein n=1 Tax=Bradyrhizobium ottawaense TaxID=931866 RepID=UPI0038328196
MSLLGKAAVAMWWSVRPEQRSEFGDWHSHEHFPERMSIPGFRRGSRWTSTTDAEGFFVLYELEQYEVLTSSGYLDRLNAPTPWSAKMMPHHLGMVRSQCRVASSFGGGVATSLATIRLSPQAGRETELQTRLSENAQRIGAAAGADRRPPPLHRHASHERAHHRAADPRQGRRCRLDRPAVGLRCRCG